MKSIFIVIDVTQRNAKKNCKQNNKEAPVSTVICYRNTIRSTEYNGQIIISNST